MITKQILLKNDPALKNHPYQLEELLSIFKHNKCLVKMFCGTGKSRIITNVIIHEKMNRVSHFLCHLRSLINIMQIIYKNA